MINTGHLEIGQDSHDLEDEDTIVIDTRHLKIG
jgi:hypothetical protein